MLEPGSRSVRVRGLQTHGLAEISAHAGTRVAVNLAGIEVSEVRRGQVLVAPDAIRAIDQIDAEIRLLPTAPPLKHRARVHFHAFTAETMAGISLYEYDAVHPGTARIVRLKLDAPVMLAPGDRFVLRHPSPVATIGGGRILDAHPEPRRRKSETLAWLKDLNGAPLPRQMALRVSRRGVSGIPLGALAREAGLTLDATRRNVDAMVQQGDIVPVSADLLVSLEALRFAKDRVARVLNDPAQTLGTSGIKSAQLRSQAALSREVFDFVIAGLVREGKVHIQGENISIAGHATASRESERLAALAQAYESAGLAAPTVPELALRFRLSEPEIRRLVTLLQRQKTILRMGSDDLFMHVRALDRLIAQMGPLRGTVLDVAGFKQLTGLSRKFAIPLLEYLDHARVTRKQGDRRLVL